MSERDLIERARNAADNIGRELSSNSMMPPEVSGVSDMTAEFAAETLRALASAHEATIARLSEALAEAEKKGAEDGVAKCLEHIAYVRANIRITPKDRVRFSVSDLNFAFRSALDVLKERITGEDEGKWHEEDAAPPPRDLSQGGQHG